MCLYTRQMIDDPGSGGLKMNRQAVEAEEIFFSKAKDASSNSSPGIYMFGKVKET